ncbi:hypothetical protein R50072_32840 [Simiduia litorea]
MHNCRTNKAQQAGILKAFAGETSTHRNGGSLLNLPNRSVPLALDTCQEKNNKMRVSDKKKGAEAPFLQAICTIAL